MTYSTRPSASRSLASVTAVLPEPAEPTSTTGAGRRRTASWASSKTMGLSSSSNSARVGCSQRSGIGLGAGLGRLDVRLVLDLRLVHRRAAQEAGLLVGVVLDHLQRQAHRLATEAGELQQQPVAVVQLGAVVAADMQLLDVRALEVTGLDGRANLDKGGLHTLEVEVLVLEQAHGWGRG